MLVALVASTLTFLSSSGVSPAVGPVLVLKGRLSYTRGKAAAVPVAVRYLARVGDVVRTDSNGRATLLYRKSGRLYTVLPGSEVRLGKTSPSELHGPKLTCSVILMDSTDVGRDERIRLGTESRTGANYFGPFGSFRQGLVLLDWEPDPGASKLRLHLEPLNGKLGRDFNLAASANSFTIPAGAVPEGKWLRARLVLAYESTPSNVREVFIRVLSERDRSRLKHAEAQLETAKSELGVGYGWAKAELFASYALVSEMVLAWKEGASALGQEPKSAPAQRELQELYGAAGVPNSLRKESVE